MGTVRKGRSERDNITVTNDYVEHHKEFLTERDKAILQLLKKYPLLSSRHLAMMVPPTNQKAFFEIKNGQQRCNERLRILFEKHWIYKFSPRKPPGKGTAPQFVTLDKAGYKYFNMKKRPTYYTDLELPRHFFHTIAVIDVIAECYKAHYNGDIKIKYISYEPDLKNTNLRPDAIVFYEKNGEYHLRWIEVDRQEKTLAKEEEKIRALEEFKLKQMWKEEDWNRELRKPVFPKVTYIVQPKTKSSNRIEQLSSLLSKTQLTHESYLHEKWTP